MAVKKQVKNIKTRKRIANSSAPISKRGDEKYVVSEITSFEGVTDIDAAIKQNLRHCNYFYNRQDASNWILKWVQKNLSPTALREFKAAETWRACLSVGTLCRMHMHGAPLPADRIEWIKSKIENEILKFGRASIKSDKGKVSSARVSPAILVKRRGEQFLSDIEAIVDSWDKLDAPFSLYSEMKSNEIPAIVAKSVEAYYTPLMNELREASSRKADEQLKQAYSHMKPAELKRYLTFIEALVTDASTYVTGKKAQRKPRVVKQKTTGQLTKKVKYQKESNELKITSVAPDKIVGSSVVLLFNTKYNTISYLVSSSKTGFTISGTTIQNIDDEKSFKKTVRKASENLHAIVSAPKARTLKLIESLKTTRATTTGRIGEDTLILKVQ